MTHIDPRAKLAVLLAASLLAAGIHQQVTAAVALLLALSLALASGQPWGRLIKRLLALNVFVVLLAVTMPWSLAMTPDWPGLTVRFDPRLLPVIGLLALKINALMALLLGLFGAETAPRILHALAHLGLPHRLVSVFFLFHRYLWVIGREKDSLLTAMRARCFVPRTNLHTYKAYADLVGMLLARSLDRADRVYAAMRCRGFQGLFPILDHFAWHGRDTAFCLMAALAMAGLIALEQHGGRLWN